MVKLTKTLQLVLLVSFLMVLIGIPGGIDGARAEKETGLRNKALVPTAATGLNYEWHTFYGVMESIVELRGIAVDSNGNVYVAGYANKSWGTPLNTYSGNRDIVVIKLNSLGAYQWHTYYGAATSTGEDGDDEASAIALDKDGNLYVTGYSDRTWQGPGDTAPLHPLTDSETMVLLKLNGNGAYQWHTFYQAGRAKAIAIDSSSNVYISGSASYAEGSPLHASPGVIVVYKFNSSGAYQWHTYYGAGASVEDEVAFGLAVDPAGGGLYVTGQTPDTWLGDGGADPLHDFTGGASYSTDLFVLKLTSAGAYQWHTFYGAAETSDIGYDLDIDSLRNVYIVGESYGSWGSPLHAFNAEDDLLVLKLNSSGAYQWHTFYGSGSDDVATGIEIDDEGRLYIGGSSNAPWQGDGGAAPVHAYSGTSGGDITVLKLTSGGTYQQHTFYGAGDEWDEGMGIALDQDNAVFTTGVSRQTWNAGGVPPLHPHSGNNVDGDGFVLKLSNRIFNLYLPLAMKIGS